MDEVPTHYVTSSELQDGFAKTEYEFHQVKSSESNFLKPGESIKIKANIVITESVGKNVGFSTVSGNPSNYWIGSVVNECFLVKTGVLSGDFLGGLYISIINKTVSSVIVKAGTNLGVFEF